LARGSRGRETAIILEISESCYDCGKRRHCAETCARSVQSFSQNTSTQKPALSAAVMSTRMSRSQGETDTKPYSRYRTKHSASRDKTVDCRVRRSSSGKQQQTMAFTRHIIDAEASLSACGQPRTTNQPTAASEAKITTPWTSWHSR